MGRNLLGRHAEGRVLCPKERGQVGAPREERGTTLLEPTAAGSGAALVVDRVELQHDAPGRERIGGHRFIVARVGTTFTNRTAARLSSSLACYGR
ncbi:MAG TPA: hypothetical protein VIH94_00965, partial [Candidatus Limnocylindrales bacterium]